MWLAIEKRCSRKILNV